MTGYKRYPTLSHGDAVAGEGASVAVIFILGIIIWAHKGFALQLTGRCNSGQHSDRTCISHVWFLWF